MTKIKRRTLSCSDIVGVPTQHETLELLGVYSCKNMEIKSFYQDKKKETYKNHVQQHPENNREEQEKYSCPICLEILHRPVLLSCKHTFCHACLIKAAPNLDSCPLCRTVQSLHPSKNKEKRVLGSYLKHKYHTKKISSKSDNSIDQTCLFDMYLTKVEKEKAFKYRQEYQHWRKQYCSGSHGEFNSAVLLSFNLCPTSPYNSPAMEPSSPELNPKIIKPVHSSPLIKPPKEITFSIEDCSSLLSSSPEALSDDQEFKLMPKDSVKDDLDDILDSLPDVFAENTDMTYGEFRFPDFDFTLNEEESLHYDRNSNTSRSIFSEIQNCNKNNPKSTLNNIQDLGTVFTDEELNFTVDSFDFTNDIDTSKYTHDKNETTQESFPKGSLSNLERNKVILPADTFLSNSVNPRMVNKEATSSTVNIDNQGIQVLQYPLYSSPFIPSNMNPISKPLPHSFPLSAFPLIPPFPWMFNTSSPKPTIESFRKLPQSSSVHDIKSKPAKGRGARKKRSFSCSSSSCTSFPPSRARDGMKTRNGCRCPKGTGIKVAPAVSGEKILLKSQESGGMNFLKDGLEGKQRNSKQVGKRARSDFLKLPENVCNLNPKHSNLNKSHSTIHPQSDLEKFNVAGMEKCLLYPFPHKMNPKTPLICPNNTVKTILPYASPLNGNMIEPRWRPVACNGLLPNPRYDCGVATYEGKMYVVGGIQGSIRHNDLHILDLNVSPPKWSRPEMFGETPSKGVLHKTFVIDSKLYVIGGTCDGYLMTDLHCLDLTSVTSNVASWKRVQFNGTPPSMRYWYAIAVKEKTLYLHGGFDGYGRLDDLYKLDFETAIPSWSCIKTIGTIPGKRSTHSAFFIHNDLYLFGGYDGRSRYNSIHKLKLDNGEHPPMWSKVIAKGKAPSIRYTHSCVSKGTKMILFGGNSGSLRNDVHILELGGEIPIWISPKVENSPDPRAWHNCVMLKDRMYLFGGHNGEEGDNCVYELNLGRFGYQIPLQLHQDCSTKRIRKRRKKSV